MKLRVELDKDETVEQADELILKAVQAKHECSGGERYADDWLNELEGYVLAQHRRVLDQIAEEIAQEIGHVDQ